jgi:glucose uptake protein
MYIVQSYPVAVVLCLITMMCWGSWANTQKMATKQWPFQLFYWDYAIGVLLISLVLGLTIGSYGEVGRSFFEDLGQANQHSLVLAFVGGVIFNIANILLVAAIDIAGMAVAFPIGIGLALVLGVIINYLGDPVGNPMVLFLGVSLVAIAIILDAVAYSKIPATTNRSKLKGIIISLVAGVLMGFFYRFVADSMVTDFMDPEVGKLTPYSAGFIFAIGLFISNFVWNSIVMYKPITGEKVTYKDYLAMGNPKLHLIGILGGVIWGIGMLLNIVASGQAGFAISYGLGQGATLIAAIWGVFIWKEFKGLKGTKVIIGAMFFFYLAGLIGIIYAKLV